MMSNIKATDQFSKQEKRVLRARRVSSSNVADALPAAAVDTINRKPQGMIEKQLKQAEKKDKQQQQETLPGAEVARPAMRRRQQQQAGPAQQQQQQPMSAFEAERAARIASNLARLAELELPQLAAGLAATAPAAAKRAAAPSQRGVGNKRRRGDEQQQPLRRSARNQGIAPDPATAGGIDVENRDGSVVVSGSSSRGHAAGESTAAAAAAEPPGPMPFRSSNGDETSDSAFLALLSAQAAVAAGDLAGSSRRSSSAEAPPTAAAAAEGSGCATGAELAGLSLAAADVAKMTKDGVSCLAFHPSSSRLIIAAADKAGKVSLWDIDYQAGEANSSSSSDYDGVLMFEPHREYVSSLKWSNSHTLVTGSYDGTVRTLDVNTGVWGLLAGVPAEAAGWSAGEVAADGAVMYLATSEGRLSVLDSRTDSSSSSTASSSTIANRKVNTLHLHSNQVHLAAAASDGSVTIWDVRSLAAATCSSSSSSSKCRKPCRPVCSVGHSKSSQGAYWAPDGSSRLLSISFDDTLRVWQDPAADNSNNLKQLLSIRHNNNTGRWVIPFRPAWSPAADAVLVGDMKRGVAVFNASTGAQQALMTAEALTAIPSRLAVHSAGLPVLAAATSSGRVHIWR